MRFILSLVLIFTLWGSAQATVATSLAPSSVAREADVIAVGRVVNLETVVQNGDPWTIATVVSEQSVKGKPSSQIRIRIPGGQHMVNGRTLITAVEGAPVLNINQKAVFFVNSNEDTDVYDFTGLNHGYWRVENRSGQEVAIPSANEAAPAVPLDRFMNDIREAMKEAKEHH
jgi:hypothetical protein